MAEDTSTLRPTRGRAELAAPPGPASAAIFERQVLVFTLLVVVLACASFLFGGRCAAWQWWTAVAAVVTAPFVRKDRRRAALGAAGLFALLLFALRCLIPPLVWDDTECADMAAYHLPMVQLLIEGWNPVADPTAEGITKSLGLDLWGMAPLHVAFLPKTMAVFSAVAYTFVGDPYALTFPLPVFLWLGVFLSGILLFRGFPRWTFVASSVFLLPLVVLRMPADLCVAFSSGGLLFAMLDTLRRKKCDWLALGIWAAWMMNLKLNGVLGAFVFCSLFVATTIWKNRNEWKKWIVRFAVFGGVLILLWGLISWNPLGTSWRTYGHPLYPFKTIDAERFPVKDLTWDLQGGNDDYFEMGRLGRFVHVYLSPRTAIAWYNWKLGRNDFEPWGVWWPWKEYPTGRVRIAILSLFCLLFLFPEGRLFGIGGLLLLVLVPEDMIGFTRYQPWLSALGCMAMVLAGERFAGTRIGNRYDCLFSGIVAACSLIALFRIGWSLSVRIECKATELDMVRPSIRANFWKGPVEARKSNAILVKSFVPRYNYLTCFENRILLLVKEAGRENRTKIEPANALAEMLGIDLDWDERDWYGNDSSEVSTSVPEKRPDAFSEEKTPGLLTPFGYWVPVDSDARHVVDYFLATGVLPDTSGRTMRRSNRSTFFHAWFVTYPQSVWRRLAK